MPAATPTESAHAVYAALRARLSAGHYAPGDRLTELELAEELGVSRTPVREALQRLHADGLVARSGRGAVVAGLSDKERHDLFRVRAVLESLAAQCAAERQRDGELAPVVLTDLRRKAAAVNQAIAAGDPRDVAQRNFEFHRLIVEAANNGSLEDFLGRTWDRIAVATVSNLTDAEWASRIGSQHEAVITAIAAGEPAAAADAMTHHIAAAARAAHNVPS